MVAESDQVDVLAPAMLGDLEQIDHTLETGLPGQLRRDVGQRHREDRRHLYLSLLHAVAIAHLHVGTHPYPHAARDLAAPDSLTQSPGEYHLCLARRFAFAPALGWRRSGSSALPASRFHLSNVSGVISPRTSNSANFRRCALLL